jgi:4-amino-4-deoxy-L-arabinose transferase-like glycosyltransferase
MTDEVFDLSHGSASRGSSFASFATKIIELWRRAAGESRGIYWVLALALLVSVPPAIFHGYHYVEGLTVAVAQNALDNGNWLTSHIYNIRWIERPMLLSWLIAAISLPFGHVYMFIARLPVVIALLAGVVLIWRALRGIVKPQAAIFGAALFLACPVVIRYYVTSVADLPLAVILFGAFLAWWSAFAAERLTSVRWIGIGCLLAIAALLKGPQPVAFFMLGLSTYVVVSRTWWQIPGLLCAGVIAAIPVTAWYGYVFVPGDQGEWLRYTRLASNGAIAPRPLYNAIDFFLECCPAALLALGLLPGINRTAAKPELRSFSLALSCYAFSCTLLILVWPAEVNPRYILPMVLPLCVLAGIAYDRLVDKSPIFIATNVCIMLGLLGYAVSHSMRDVFLTPGYNHTRTDGAKLTRLFNSSPAPIFRTGWLVALNEFAYVADRVTIIAPEAVKTIQKPAWLVVPTNDAPSIIASGGGHVTPRLSLYDTVVLRLE